MKPNDILFRCSKLSEIMTNYDSKSLTKGHLTACKKIHREITWKRTSQIKHKYIEKGNACEEDSLTLLSRVDKIFLTKNEERVSNDWIIGTPDTYTGKELMKTKHGYDVKSSWSWETFPYAGAELDDVYYWQNMGYMALTGAERWTTAYCLVNATPSLITSAKKSLWYEMGCPDETNKDYLEKSAEIEKTMIYDLPYFKKLNPHFDLDCKDWSHDIPMEERVLKITVERKEEEINKIYERVKMCREHMNIHLFKTKSLETLLKESINK